MSKIYLIRHETSYGPFLSSREKARDYLEQLHDEADSSEIEEMLEGNHPYTNMIEVELDDKKYRFDG